MLCLQVAVLLRAVVVVVLVLGSVLAMRVVVGPKCMGVQLRGSGCKRPLGKWASLWPVAPVAGGCCW